MTSTPAPQAIATGLTNAAIFLTVTINPGAEATVREVCAGVSGLVRAVGFRDPGSTLSVVTGFGADAWRRLAAAADRGTGRDHRAQEALRHRARRRREAQQRAQCADLDHDRR